MPPRTSPLRAAHRRQRPPGWRPWDLPEACKPGIAVPSTLVERFRSIMTVDWADCWKPSQRKIQVSGVMHTVQQASWRLYKSDAPPRFISTTCDTELCCNPNHLIGSDELCRKGLHPMAPENQKSYSDGRILCLACHLERWSKCKQGHDLDETARVTTSGYRVCNVCVKNNMARYWERRRDEGVLESRRQKYKDMSPEDKERMLEARRQKYRQRRAQMTLEERAADARARAEARRNRRAAASSSGTDPDEAEGRTA